MSADTSANVDERLAACGLDPARVRASVRAFLDEDLSEARRDVTSEPVFDADHTSTVVLASRADGVLAGLPVAHAVFAATAEDTDFEYLAAEGARIRDGQLLARITGPTRGILAAERTALNLLCRMSGVASHTRRFADRLADWTTRVLDTRKTTPGLRLLEKYAVRAGGGGNKRFGLDEVAMIKDNHKEAAGSITAAYNAIRGTHPDIEIEVEVETLDEAREAVAAGARWLLCDNMSPKELSEVVVAVGAVADLEATGRITLDNVVDYAAVGADFVSVGALTHSSPILDIGLDFEE
jgi:nicotinate-nucleotide pyrophosphorylase (carboxylating)